MGKTQLTQPNNIGFEQVWAILQETARRQEEYAKQEAKRQEEYAKRQDKIDRQVEDLNKRFGDFSNRFGEIVEHMIAPNLREKFKDLGFIFPKANSNTDVSDYENNIFFEIDVLLENGEKAMLVEIKTKPTNTHIKTHIKRLEKMRIYADLHGDNRTFLGAVAGVVIPKNIREHALSQGLFIVEPSGETFNITPPFGKPKEW